jgi:hypothetical protein
VWNKLIKRTCLQAIINYIKSGGKIDIWMDRMFHLLKVKREIMGRVWNVYFVTCHLWLFILLAKKCWKVNRRISSGIQLLVNYAFVQQYDKNASYYGYPSIRYILVLKETNAMYNMLFRRYYMNPLRLGYITLDVTFTFQHFLASSMLTSNNYYIKSGWKMVIWTDRMFHLLKVKQEMMGRVWNVWLATYH